MQSAFTDPLVVRMLRENRLALFNREDAQLKRMSKDWLAIERSLENDMYILAQEIIDAQSAGKSITGQLIREMARYKKLNSQLKAQVLKYSKDSAAKDISAEQQEYAMHGVLGAVDAIKGQLAFGISFNTLSVEAFEDLSGMLGDGTPLNTLLREAYPDALDGIIKSMLEGVAKGLGPNQIANMMADGMGLGLQRITLIARTEQLRMWRTATQRQYQESGVVLAHERLSARDSRVCPACLALDGEIIPVDQVLDDHPRGRCTSIPILIGSPRVKRQYGEEWFYKQPEDVKEQILGKGRYDLFNNGGFQFQDLARKTYDPVWGASPSAPSLRELKQALSQ